jgi:hypothetical protein
VDDAVSENIGEVCPNNFSESIFSAAVIVSLLLPKRSPALNSPAAIGRSGSLIWVIGKSARLGTAGTTCGSVAAPLAITLPSASRNCISTDLPVASSTTAPAARVSTAPS